MRRLRTYLHDVNRKPDAERALLLEQALHILMINVRPMHDMTSEVT